MQKHNKCLTLLQKFYIVIKLLFSQVKIYFCTILVKLKVPVCVIFADVLK